ncbi:hypothetical protein [Streptomyces sp. NPDC058193]|uniref:hypothetical protein n=1 Tax=Streptomyces sp. NPDC058193 TaxID=3346373 RepID=UPI0036E0E0C6
MTTEPRLPLRVVVPPLGAHGAVECRPVIDGRDVLADVFEEGPAEDPRHLLGPEAPLHATEAPVRSGSPRRSAPKDAAAPSM